MMNMMQMMGMLQLLVGYHWFGWENIDLEASNQHFKIDIHE